MTTIAGSGSINNGGVAKHQWTLTVNGDDGAPARLLKYGNTASLQVVVTAAGTWEFEGSNDGGANWQPLRIFDYDTGDFVVLTGQTSSLIATLVDLPELIRPRLSAGATPNITFTVTVGTRK